MVCRSKWKSSSHLLQSDMFFNLIFQLGKDLCEHLASTFLSSLNSIICFYKLIESVAFLFLKNCFEHV